MCQNHKETSKNPSHFESISSSIEHPTHTEMLWNDYKNLIQGMRFFDPHIHMVSRTTDDYQMMAKAGIVAIIEPAFWVGQPRTGLSSFKDYYSSLVGWERFRSSQFGIKHYCTMGLNSREANNERLAEEVMEILPLFAYKEGVVGIGEIGFDDQTPLEEKYYRLQLELAKKAKLPVQIHTPHRDKKRGTERSMSIAIEHGLDPSWVVVDHNNEETVKSVLDQGFWAAFTIYPFTKMGNERMVAVVEKYGQERIMINSSADWGISDPLAIPKTAALMKQKGIPLEVIRMVTYQNAIDAFAKSGQIDVTDFESDFQLDPNAKFHGNSILRGGQQPVLDKNSLFIQ
ncbi:TatD family hydrolase [Leptospira sp. 2 VSF19]|uniref:TatD family hydrolase n=1 Tax=Leptospira soteropolitanensis TaxID=2950025 RepID=A0AAW5VE88_9LEPT|nr:TatD family hydrolase [Leptospira soteropolitanensis]MCW7493605.1 TatD family hydrolase [Leptospira soteropolitanensis]MCW7501204.1 TatD family hydrolase [Leptospira soteropolitanensis]MCW7523610.1 TatD family hydrolase [Leptospira soteropolitanensis]MCW7527317.1 TatD family hydrolase [Leptospira soteropolitanensis]MCW7531174.1 TatD family hydrolase [Leptospira soteropolitanensis]